MSPLFVDPDMIATKAMMDASACSCWFGRPLWCLLPLAPQAANPSMLGRGVWELWVRADESQSGRTTSTPTHGKGASRAPA